MKTSLDYKKITKTALVFVTRYRVFITIGVLVGIFGFAVIRINQLSDPKANQDRLVEATKEYKKVNIDQGTVDNIQALVESNVQVDPKFNNRDNPFAE